MSQFGAALARPQNRRRHTRLAGPAIDPRVAIIERNTRELSPLACSVVNLSFGGVCVRTPHCAEPGTVLDLLIDLGRPFSEFVVARGKVVWSNPEAGILGLCFVRCSKGWLGPEDESDEW